MYCKRRYFRITQKCLDQFPLHYIWRPHRSKESQILRLHVIITRTKCPAQCLNTIKKAPVSEAAKVFQGLHSHERMIFY
jgi:hypothetical protein